MCSIYPSLSGLRGLNWGGKSKSPPAFAVRGVAPGLIGIYYTPGISQAV
jgi:hypothetical protein